MRVDSDDYINKEFANILSLYLEENPKKLGVACDYYLINDKEKNSTGFQRATNSLRNYVQQKKLLREGLYNIKFKHREEEELRCRLGERYEIHNLSLPLYRYRMHLSNKTKSKDYLDKFKLKIIEIKKKNLIKNKEKVFIKKYRYYYSS